MGNIVHVGNALPEVKTVGDIIDRLNRLMNVEIDKQMLESERVIRRCNYIQEASIAAQCNIILGERKNSVKKVIHMFPHTGFNVNHLENLMKDNPYVDTLLATISHVSPGHALISKAEEYNLNFVCSNSHAMEIYENGLPLLMLYNNTCHKRISSFFANGLPVLHWISLVLVQSGITQRIWLLITSEIKDKAEAKLGKILYCPNKSNLPTIV